MTAFVWAAMWVAGLTGAFIGDTFGHKTVETPPTDITYYRIGIDYDGNTHCVEKR